MCVCKWPNAGYMKVTRVRLPGQSHPAGASPTNRARTTPHLFASCSPHACYSLPTTLLISPSSILFIPAIGFICDGYTQPAGCMHQWACGQAAHPTRCWARPSANIIYTQVKCGGNNFATFYTMLQLAHAAFFPTSWTFKRPLSHFCAPWWPGKVDFLKFVCNPQQLPCYLIFCHPSTPRQLSY